MPRTETIYLGEAALKPATDIVLELLNEAETIITSARVHARGVMVRERLKRELPPEDWQRFEAAETALAAAALAQHEANNIRTSESGMSGLDLSPTAYALFEFVTKLASAETARAFFLAANDSLTAEQTTPPPVDPALATLTVIAGILPLRAALSEAQDALGAKG